MNPPRVALVTGSGNGLGEVIARNLHQAGYRVAIADIDEPAAQAVAASLGDSAMALPLDVRRKPDFERALAAILRQWGDIQVLVNNAASTIARPTMEISPEEFDDVLAINLRGTFFGCQVLGAHFRDQGHGRIINMASLAGQNGGTTAGAHYAASKGGIVTLTKVFARDLAKHGVTVNAVAPGPLDLPAVHKAVPPDKLAQLKQAIPVGDIGDPNFIAQLIIQLASPEAAYATGATWDVNGGLYAR